MTLALIKSSEYKQPDWLNAAIKHYKNTDDLEFLHNYTDQSHLLILGKLDDILSDNKDVRNKAKVPLNIDNNIAKWASSDDIPKVDYNTISEKLHLGSLLGLVPSTFNLIVLDIDRGDYKKVILEAGDPICILNTPSGGQHLYYKLPEGIDSVGNYNIGDYVDGIDGDVRCSAGYVALYEKHYLTKMLKCYKKNNTIKTDFLRKILGKKSGLKQDKLANKQITSYNINEGPDKFAKTTAGRNNVANAMLYRDAIYGLLDEKQIAKYIEGCKKNDFDVSELLKLITHCKNDGEIYREKHYEKFNVYPQHLARDDSGLLFDVKNPLEIQRVISEVVNGAEYRLRSDSAYFRFNDNDDWYEYDDTSALRIKKQVASEGYYTSNGKKDFVANIPVDDINLEMNQRFKDNEIDVIKDYFESLKGKWDGKDRLNRLMVDLFACENTPLLGKKTSLFLTGIYDRVSNPGCKFDYMFFFTGPQGIGKSSWFNYLFPGNFSQYAVSSNVNLQLNLQRLIEGLSGACIMLFDEGFSRQQKERENLKALITATKHTYRKPYARVPQTTLASYILCSTTNEDSFLTSDASGNRRFIVFPLDPLKKLDKQRNGFNIKKYLDKNRDQIWAEVIHKSKKTDYTFDDTLIDEINKERDKYRLRDLKYEHIVSEAISNGVLKNKTRWSVILWEAGLLQTRSGMKQDMDSAGIRRGLIEGDSLTSLNLVGCGNSYDREKLKEALLHYGYRLKRGRPITNKDSVCTICINDKIDTVDDE